VETIDKIGAAEAAAGEEGHIRVGKLNLVDLAGSERQSKTGATGDRLKASNHIIIMIIIIIIIIIIIMFRPVN
jgi:hypothetical protein